ncbi:hypothetical protein ABAC402_10595 [Asticcacaulis sp. AC402]|nr:hypothetical protein ABAC402_10595 [Asticcacaulis sp. AC402]
MKDTKNSKITEAEADFADAAVTEYEQNGSTAKTCPRCRGNFVIDVRGNSYSITCVEGDFKLTFRGI